MIYRFDTLGSTNDEAQRDIYNHGDIIIAEKQSAGRGQRGNKWLSGEGLNLTLSTIVTPNGIEVRRQFLISQAVALAICDMLILEGLNPRIKWTNDIYIGDEKIVGILIENKLSGGELHRSIVGIGLNVNQREFDPELPNPTSMALASNKLFDRDAVLQNLAECLKNRFLMLEEGKYKEIAEQYHNKMYCINEPHPFKLSSGEIQVGSIVGVESSGELLIDWQSGERGAYLFGAIDFIIDRRKR
ncbi:MAG: biotin--[acetyl-CoA-carboxylase] ligase [Rikenellaceae bacterium]